MDSGSLIFRLQKDRSIKVVGIKKYTIYFWTPGLFRIKPKDKGVKYIVYWIFHYLRVFKNRQYCYISVFNENEKIASAFAVPAYYKWPFMKKDDVQFTYVMTDKKYRGKGIAGKLLNEAICQLRDSVKDFWYVTNSNNIPSIRLAEKTGFSLYSEGKRSGILKIIKPLNYNSHFPS